MYTSTVFSIAVLLISSNVNAYVHPDLVERATLNGPCTGSGGAPGVCISTGDCTSGGGNYITNACPGTPDNIRCCTKTSCGNGGNCRFTSSCSTSTLTGLCPGPADFKCCVPAGGGGGSSGPYPPPRIPSVGACKAHAVSGAEKVVSGNSGKVREIYYFMCSSAGGVRTDSGRPIAEWVMNNRASLNLKYVIWGQKIWNPSRDSVGPWTGWRGMEDRGSITANHCQHKVNLFHFDMSQTATCEVELDAIRPAPRRDEPSLRLEPTSVQDVDTAEFSRIRTAVIIATLTGITTVSSFSSGLLTVALPRMAKDVNLAPNLLLWPASVYPFVWNVKLVS
ncbi:MAG: hypothetical protein L6R41_004849 [Letrouitia leprolyta]|nr:MAG: hypothetical protein L6R41_004849 [Letrouitia leprolyta]